MKRRNTFRAALALLLKEPFSVWQMLGVAVILVCVFVANVSGGKES